jgi:hypothetical protein
METKERTKVPKAVAALLAGLLVCLQAPGATLGGQAAGHASEGARLWLANLTSSVEQTASSGWTLEKTGALDPAASTVTWQIEADDSAPVSHRLLVRGLLAAWNLGHEPATVGNVVVHLQAKTAGQWITLSSDAADATDGDAATEALIVAGGAVETVTENAASGALALRHAFSKEPIPLVPQPSLPSGAIVPVEFEAAFDNDVLGLAAGVRVRAQVIVTYGNAGEGSGSAADADINGSGFIDPDEARVRSESVRTGERKIPAPGPDGAEPTLSDTIGDITTTGTVTFTNAIFNVGATSGTVTVTYDAGSDGGTITNCAYLEGPGISESDCDTQTIEAPGYWQPGEIVTYTQLMWRTDPTASGVLSANFAAVYAGNGGLLEVGIDGAAGYSMEFGAASSVLDYLPAVGASGPLTMDLLDPTSSPSGAFGGLTVSLALNVDYSAANLIGTGSIAFGDVYVCGVAGFEGYTVSQVLATANTLLGGGAAPQTIAQTSQLADDLNLAFVSGSVLPFAEDHLRTEPCP